MVTLVKEGFPRGYDRIASLTLDQTLFLYEIHIHQRM